MSNDLDFLKDLNRIPFLDDKPLNSDEWIKQIVADYIAAHPHKEEIVKQAFSIISPKGVQLILDYEVGGGKSYYEKNLKKPTVPAYKTTQSGCTIGIGWDAGYNTKDTLYKEWGQFLSSSDLQKMEKVLGLKSYAAHDALSGIASVDVTWDDALGQFTEFTISRFYALALRSFKGLDEAPQAVKDVVLSLVFNRGNSLKGSSRREMAEIARLIQTKEYSKIPDQILAMKRLWPDVKGLLRRRDAEAKYLKDNL